MTYSQAISFLYSLGNEVLTAKLGLDNTKKLLRFLGHPQESFRSVLIAGTNGKGSVAAFSESVLRTAGYKTGLYTSPHLVRIEERIRVNGKEISPETFARLTHTVKDAIIQLQRGVSRDGHSIKLDGHPTFFEIVTVIAFLYFAESQIEIAILEVGLGGRLDATNVVNPIVSVITSVSYDHQAYLGHQLEAIAAEKAGIIKPTPLNMQPRLRVVCSSENEVVIQLVKKRCQSVGATFVSAFQDLRFKVVDNSFEKFSLWVEPVLGRQLELTIPLPGSHQIGNVLAAIRALEILHHARFPLHFTDFKEGIARTCWPGRLEVIQTQPRLVLDGAHNPAAAKSVSNHIRSFLPSERIILVYGSMGDKDIGGILSNLTCLAREIILTRPDSERGTASLEILKSATGFNTVVRLTRSMDTAWRVAHSLAYPEDTILVLGSLFLVGDVKRRLIADGKGKSQRDSEDGLMKTMKTNASTS